ncbi:tubulin glycylase 3B-like [Hyposmocoma kahamanoa]|uniref:tubulin glycylase 3B-like n=1 Tax=Hyposmocoma kahamanoa TaxID=1477025 RepID=UPI000E6D7808|nr:tubulin glycylase 3B-like [Hyposmocoma kahamanoa]
MQVSKQEVYKQRKMSCRNEVSPYISNENYLNDLQKKHHHSCVKFKAIEAVKSRKVFTVYGQGSKAVRRALIERGWFEKVPRNKRYYNIWKRPEQSFLSNFLQKYNANFIWGTNSSKEITSMKAVKKKPKTICPIRNRLEVVNDWCTKLHSEVPTAAKL